MRLRRNTPRTPPLRQSHKRNQAGPTRHHLRRRNPPKSERLTHRPLVVRIPQRPRRPILARSRRSIGRNSRPAARRQRPIRRHRHRHSRRRNARQRHRRNSRTRRNRNRVNSLNHTYGRNHYPEINTAQAGAASGRGVIGHRSQRQPKIGRRHKPDGKPRQTRRPLPFITSLPRRAYKGVIVPVTFMRRGGGKGNASQIRRCSRLRLCGRPFPPAPQRLPPPKGKGGSDISRGAKGYPQLHKILHDFPNSTR